MPMTAFPGSLFRHATVLTLLLVLGACGGGGGSDTDDGSTTPPPNPGPSVSGRLWHDNFALDFLDGTQIASASGAAPTQVTPKLAAWPWPDGTQYVTADWDVTRGQTTVTVANTATGNTVQQLVFDGYVRSVKPSPASKNVLLATWSEDSVSPATYVFYDFQSKTVLDSFSVADAAVNWLPDGRYVRVTADGRITIGTVGGAQQAGGQVAVPAGLSVNNLWVNPQGNQMALQLWAKSVSGNVEQTDLWVAALDGSNLGRLTSTGITSYGKWSPDGQYLAFDVDTGTTCGGGSCAGQCELHYAGASARNLTALQASGDTARFRVKNRQGQERVLGCELLGWTQ